MINELAYLIGAPPYTGGSTTNLPDAVKGHGLPQQVGSSWSQHYQGMANSFPTYGQIGLANIPEEEQKAIQMAVWRREFELRRQHQEWLEECRLAAEAIKYTRLEF